jgi:tRNA threonylcarbamoyladenosine biosynthesis protein TsaB
MRTGPLLALETSTATARVAVVADGGEGVLAAGEKTAARHSANLLALVDEALGSAGVRLPDLAAIACGAGPGSFTGLRVGLAVAKGLALPTDLPLVLVSSLEILAHDLIADGPSPALVVPCLDAGKEQVYARLYRASPGAAPVALSEEWAVAPADLVRRVAAARGRDPVRAGGTGVDRYLDLFRAELGDAAVSAAVPGPSALALARLARVRLSRGESDDLATAVPRYGRPPDITRPRSP